MSLGSTDVASSEEDLPRIRFKVGDEEVLGKSSFYHPMVDDTAIATPTQKMVPWVEIEWPATIIMCWDGSRWRLSNHLQPVG